MQKKTKEAEQVEEVKQVVNKTAKMPVIVVSEAITQPISMIRGDDGKDYEVLTTNEALAEIITRLRQLDE